MPTTERQWAERSRAHDKTLAKLHALGAKLDAMQRRLTKGARTTRGSADPLLEMPPADASNAIKRDWLDSRSPCRTESPLCEVSPALIEADQAAELREAARENAELEFCAAIIDVRPRSLLPDPNASREQKQAWLKY